MVSQHAAVAPGKKAVSEPPNWSNEAQLQLFSAVYNQRKSIGLVSLCTDNIEAAAKKMGDSVALIGYTH
jgi:hypothetical protein